MPPQREVGACHCFGGRFLVTTLADVEDAEVVEEPNVAARECLGDRDKDDAGPIAMGRDTGGRDAVFDARQVCSEFFARDGRSKSS